MPLLPPSPEPPFLSPSSPPPPCASQPQAKPGPITSYEKLRVSDLRLPCSRRVYGMKQSEEGRLPRRRRRGGGVGGEGREKTPLAKTQRSSPALCHLPALKTVVPKPPNPGGGTRRSSAPSLRSRDSPSSPSSPLPSVPPPTTSPTPKAPTEQPARKGKNREAAPRFEGDLVFLKKGPSQKLVGKHQPKREREGKRDGNQYVTNVSFPTSLRIQDWEK